MTTLQNNTTAVERYYIDALSNNQWLMAECTSGQFYYLGTDGAGPIRELPSTAHELTARARANFRHLFPQSPSIWQRLFSRQRQNDQDYTLPQEEHFSPLIGYRQTAVETLFYLASGAGIRLSEYIEFLPQAKMPHPPTHLSPILQPGTEEGESFLKSVHPISKHYIVQPGYFIRHFWSPELFPWTLEGQEHSLELVTDAHFAEQYPQENYLWLRFRNLVKTALQAESLSPVTVDDEFRGNIITRYPLKRNGELVAELFDIWPCWGLPVPPYCDAMLYVLRYGDKDISAVRTMVEQILDTYLHVREIQPAQE